MTSKEEWLRYKQTLLKKKEHHLSKLEEAENERAKKLTYLLKGYKIKPGEDVYSFPVLSNYNRKIISHDLYHATYTYYIDFVEVESCTQEDLKAMFPNFKVEG